MASREKILMVEDSEDDAELDGAGAAARRP